MRRGPQFKDKDRWIVRLLGTERSCWVSGCSLLIWACIHRYRHHLKTELALIDDKRARDGTIAELKRRVNDLQRRLEQQAETESKTNNGEETKTAEQQ